jgi:hypothetical protein
MIPGEEGFRLQRTGAIRDPTVSQVVALAGVFGVGPSYLLDRSEPVFDGELVEALRDEATREIARLSERELALAIVRQMRDQKMAPSGYNCHEPSETRRFSVADTRGPEAGSNPILAVPVRRRVFLSLGLAGIVGLSLVWAPGCGSSQDGRGNGKKGKKGDGGGGAGGY